MTLVVRCTYIFPYPDLECVQYSDSTQGQPLRPIHTMQCHFNEASVFFVERFDQSRYSLTMKFIIIIYSFYNLSYIHEIATWNQGGCEEL